MGVALASSSVSAACTRYVLTLLSPTLLTTTDPIYRQHQAGKERSDVAPAFVHELHGVWTMDLLTCSCNIVSH